MRLMGVGIAGRQRLVERLDGQSRLQVIGERPTDDLAREGVDDDGEIDEVLGKPDVSNVGDPDLIEACGARASRQIGPDREAVFAVSGARNERPGAQREQIVLTRQPQHALGVDDQALPAQLLRDAAIAVMAMIERDALDQVAQVRVVSRRGVRAEMPVVASPRYVAQRAQALDVGVVLREALRLDSDHFFDDRVEVGATPFGLVASQSRKASRKKCRSAC